MENKTLRNTHGSILCAVDDDGLVNMSDSLLAVVFTFICVFLQFHIVSVDRHVDLEQTDTTSLFPY